MDWLPVQIGDTLEEFLVQATDDAGLRQVLMSMSEAVRTIAFKVETLMLTCCHSGPILISRRSGSCGVTRSAHECQWLVPECRLIQLGSI